jgi:hypothetical protein
VLAEANVLNQKHILAIIYALQKSIYINPLKFSNPAGFFSGCSLALVIAIGVLVHARGILKSKGRDQYMENIFPLYRYVPGVEVKAFLICIHV